MMRMTYLEGLNTMENFLEKFYIDNTQDDLGLLLGGISITTFLGGGTADPAAWEDWLEAIEKLQNGKTVIESGAISEREAFDAMIIFVQEFGKRISSEEMRLLLKEILVPGTTEPQENSWVLWTKSISEVTANSNC